ncbi:MAG: dethiobiotin synthase [Steroidobacteraceae bacterium]
MTRAWPRGFFVTGTDTGVGKTHVSVALMQALARNGARVVGMKPVASGCELQDGRLVNEDALLLWRAGNVDVQYADVNPYAFAPAIAPHAAAAAAGVAIDLELLRLRFDALAARADCVVVEGAGGWRVPLGPGFGMADLAARLELPVLLVVGMRLGCLNHALLTVESIATCGLRLAGWIANDPGPPMEAREASVLALRERLPAPCIADLAWRAPLPLESIASHCLAISF